MPTTTAQRFEVDFDQEICCELCNEVVHFHMDECPVCHETFAATDQYCAVYQCTERGGAFECEECGTSFKILEFDYDREPKEALIEVVKLGAKVPSNG